ncbi:MAG: hypothetical protein MR993_00050 [Spirochaetes bacterium]|nr:hypothetical protein [Spirochaetota bacterium]
MHPKPALLFFITKKVSKKASPLGTYKTYFEPGVLQLPTVKQIKRLYNSVQNRFYKQVLKGAFNGKRHGNGKQQQQKTKANSTAKENNNGKSRAENGALFYAVQNSTRVSVCRLFFQICAVWAGLSLGAVWLYAT